MTAIASSKWKLGDEVKSQALQYPVSFLELQTRLGLQIVSASSVAVEMQHQHILTRETMATGCGWGAGVQPLLGTAIRCVPHQRICVVYTCPKSCRTVLWAPGMGGYLRIKYNYERTIVGRTCLHTKCAGSGRMLTLENMKSSNYGQQTLAGEPQNKRRLTHTTRRLQK
jgi:hypothetical protein